MDNLLADLTPAQREAVTHVEGPMLVLAGPGSGKTRVITHRIAYLLSRGVEPREILALTFTNKAADEMRSRLERLAPDRPVWIGTFHRFCAQTLRRHAALVALAENFTIYDTEDSGRALRRAINAAGVDTAHVTPDAIRGAIGWAKNRLVGPGDYEVRPGDFLGALVAKVYPEYQRLLLACNAVDFDDLLLHVASLLRENPEIRRQLDRRYRFVLIDEYQDTNLAQYVIARALSIDYPNLVVTGDPDQSIYGWRGAHLKNILDFEVDYPEVRVVRLEQNYRSTKRILEVAAELIAHNVKRKEKDLFTGNAEGEPVRLTQCATHVDEAEAIVERIAEETRSGRRSPRDYAVFYRINALSLEFEKALRRRGIPFQIVRGTEFFQRREVRDVVAYLQLLANPRNDVAFMRVVNTPARGIGQTTTDRLTEFARRHGLALVEAAGRAGEIPTLAKRAAGMVGRFAALFAKLAAAVDAPIEELLGNVLERSGYQAALEASGSEEDEQRLANIQQLLSVGREFDERHVGPGRLEAFLEETALVGDTDDWEEKTDRVTLMTLHASKGLEFPVVFIVAVEEGLLPHERCRNHPDQLEEERRLLFVGITRAQEELQLSYAVYRDFRGQRRMAIPSPFLMELPRARMTMCEVGRVHEEREEGTVPFFAPGATAGLSSSARRETLLDKPAVAPSLKTFSDKPPAQRPPRRTPGAVPLRTAAEMLQGQSASPVSSEVFHQGMLVRHPQYGLGRIVALGGSGALRKATVEFPPPVGQRKFVLQSSPLRPVASG
ncbi:MAG: UvrD-helicase domain-containing protein [Pirellulales bacterium]|nr:UvrD-helicase domain-containing protein [Pirellulales bacterium]